MYRSEVSVYRTDCRFFTGYRPCSFGGACDGCGDYQSVQLDVLLINLDALGDVLRTTALLPAIRRQYPRARITWLTRARARSAQVRQQAVGDLGLSAKNGEDDRQDSEGSEHAATPCHGPLAETCHSVAAACRVTTG